MAKPVITVIGGTGSQGGGVVDALLADGAYAVRVPTRDPDSAAARRLAERGVQLVQANLHEPATLRAAFEGAHGAFVVTNFWDPEQMQQETEVGVTAVKAARAAGVQHLVWSTLPDCAAISEGRFEVVHFTGKARVDEAVEAAGFARHTFVEAPFYFQNFLGMLGPQPLPTGRRGWAVPMDPAARVIHAGDVTEVGRAVAAAFGAGDRLPNGSHLAVCGGAYSWNDFVAAFNALGNDFAVIQVPGEAYDGFFPGAHEMREMFEYFEAYTYFGPKAEQHIAAANALVPGGFTPLRAWLEKNWKDAPAA